MSNRTLLRPIERRDVRALLDIIRDTRAGHEGAARGDSVLAPADFGLYDRYQARRTIYFVALVEGEVVGGAGIAPWAADDWLTCELRHMYLTAEARERGVGELLLDACLEAARRFWYSRCYADPLAQMNHAIDICSQSGFVQLSGEMAEASRPHNDGWLMRELKAPQEAI